MARAELTVKLQFAIWALDDVHDLAKGLNDALDAKRAWRGIAIDQSGVTNQLRKELSEANEAVAQINGYANRWAGRFHDLERSADIWANRAHGAEGELAAARDQAEAVVIINNETAQKNALLRKGNISLTEEVDEVLEKNTVLRDQIQTLSRAVADAEAQRDEVINALRPWWDSEDTGDSLADGRFIDALPDWAIEALCED